MVGVVCNGDGDIGHRKVRYQGTLKTRQTKPHSAGGSGGRVTLEISSQGTGEKEPGICNQV